MTDREKACYLIGLQHGKGGVFKATDAKLQELLDEIQKEMYVNSESK